MGSKTSTPAPAAKSSPAPLFHSANGVLGLALLALTFWAFLPGVDNDFVRFDDLDYVTSNYVVQRGISWDGVVWAFSSTTVANWHPLTWLSHMLDCQFFGLNPVGHHLTSILLHAGNTWLVFVVLRGLTGARWRSFLVAAFFGWHPLRAESVAWVAERKDVLSTLFWLLTLWAYASYVRGIATHPVRSRMLFGLALLAFVGGLLAKPMVVTLPFALLLLDFWPLARWRQKRWPTLVLEKSPFFLLSAAASAITFIVQRASGAMDAVLPIADRLGNALIAYVRYLGKIFWPVDLEFFYPHPQHWPGLMVMLAGLTLLGISWLAVSLRYRMPSQLTGWLWFLGTLVPVIGLVQVGQQSIADRYSYIPSLGILIALIWGGHQCVAGRDLRVRAAKLATGVALLLCLLLTRQQTRHWKNAESLARHALSVTPDNHLAHDLLGEVFEERGQYVDALRERLETLRLQPNYAPAHNNLGILLQKQNRLPEAIEHFQIALHLHPRYPEARYNLGAAFEAANRPDEAIREYERALALRPDYVDAHYNLGLLLGRLGRLAAAITQFQETLRINPNAADAYNNLGVTLDRLGRPEEAIHQYQEAIRVQPEFARAHFNLGVALAGTRRLNEARQQFEEALRLKPDYAEAQTNLSTVLLLLGAPGGKP
jgi:tetratricopeptide (TPR) repeat protein